MVRPPPSFRRMPETTRPPSPGDVDPGFRRGDGGGEWLVVSGQWSAPTPRGRGPRLSPGRRGGRVVSGQWSVVGPNPPGTWTPAFAGETGGEAWLVVSGQWSAPTPRGRGPRLSPGRRGGRRGPRLSPGRRGGRRGPRLSPGRRGGGGGAGIFLIFLSFPLIFGPVVDSRKGAPDRYHARVWSRGLGMGKCQWGAFHAEGAEITQSTQRLRFKHRDRREHREVDGGPLSTSH